ncbi:hypothetical protein VTH06DRAFT_1221 [Thermothelomyces fergusii]
MSRPPEPQAAAAAAAATTTTKTTTTAEEALGDPTALGAAVDSLAPALELLERFHHRNKNQHRTCKWWAQADMLRRHLRKLLAELERARGEADRRRRRHHRRPPDRQPELQNQGPQTLLLRQGACGTRVATRAEYLRARLGPRAFLAFTQLAADRQFAHLGLMLLGVLAQVDRAAAPFAPDAREALAVREQTAGGPTTTGTGTAGVRSGGSGAAVAVETGRDGDADADTAMAMDVDAGVAVSREEVMASIERDVDPRTSTSTPTPRLPSGSDHADPAGKADPRSVSLPINTLPTHRTSHGGETPAARTEPAGEESRANLEPAATKPRKKKARKGDEFDDIFAGLDSGSKKPKKKKRKKGDEFDDIFSGL